MRALPYEIVMGYQLLDELDPVCHANQVIGYCLLCWVVEGVNREVICADYHGKYPAVGIQYDQATPTRDLGRRVTDAIRNTLRSRSVQDFVAFIEASQRDWHGELERLFALA